jgi:diguanylate cyclase (GGDEF)-like protein/PAS domain S-box-containing protein
MKDRGTHHRQDMEQENFRELFDAAPDSIVILDSNGKIVMVNSRFEEVFGYRRSAVLGAQVDMLVPGRFSHHPNHVIDFLKHPRKRPMGHVLEFAALGADGSEFPADISLSLYMTDQGFMIFAIIRDISDRVRHQQQLSHQANHDGLTGLPNRRLLLDRIEQATFHSKRYNRSAALLYIDLDHFKIINSSLGHNEGDKLLKITADRLSACGRECDTVARQGEDDFVLVVGDIAADHNVAKIAEKVLDTINQPIELDFQELQVTCSIGISICPKDGTNSQVLLNNADAAMLHAKEHGRNSYQFFTPQLSEVAVERLTMEKCLRRALEKEEFRIVYQPQVDLTNGQITGVEALLRWDSAELGGVSPGTFIPVAEETGLIVAIGEWVLENACRQSSRWQKAGLPPLTMAVNLSPRQFWAPGLADFIHQALVDCGLDPSFLELEITESMMMRDKQHAVSMLKKLKDTGVKLAIDDFGTGYSSLSQLRNFPFDKLKLDSSFVREIISDPGSAAIARTIISLGHNLGLTVIAEGVETEAQLSYLWSNGCDEMQGYYFSRPLPAEEME